MRFLTKIYVYKNNLYLSNCGEYIKEKNMPYGENPNGGFIIGPVVVGKNNIAISLEAIEMFKYIVNNAEHTRDDIGSLDICKMNNNEIVLSWIGENNVKIDPNNLHDIFIGCGEGQPDLSLLNKLQIKDNNFLKDYKFENLEDIEVIL